MKKKLVYLMLFLVTVFSFPLFVNAQEEVFFKQMNLSPRMNPLYMEMSGIPAIEGIDEFVNGNAGMVVMPLAYNRSTDSYFSSDEFINEMNYPTGNSLDYPTQFFGNERYNFKTQSWEISSSVALTYFYEDDTFKSGLDFAFYKTELMNGDGLRLSLHENRPDFDFDSSFWMYSNRGVPVSYKVKLDVQKIAGENINFTMDNVSEINKKTYNINDNTRKIIEFDIDPNDTPDLKINSGKDGSIIRIKYIYVFGVFDEKKISSFTMTPEKYTLAIGKSKLLYPKIEPDTAVNKKVIYKSSDNSIVQVYSNGKIKGLKTGVATITATTEDGGFTATSIINVE